MSQTVYEKRCSASRGASVKAFADVLLPLLRSYGLPDGPHEIDPVHNGIIGDPGGARLEYAYDSSSGNLYESAESRETLTSHELAYAATGESLDLLVDLHDVEWAGRTLHLRFSGEAADVEKCKEAVQPVLAACTF